MNAADLLIWFLPLMCAAAGGVFLLLSTQVRGARWWSFAYLVAALGFASMATPLPYLQIPKALLEDATVLLAIAAMSRGLALRFEQPVQDRIAGALIAATIAAASVALIVYDSVTWEIAYVQMACAALQLLGAWHLRVALHKPAYRALFFVQLALVLVLTGQTIYGVIYPQGLTLDGWRDTPWAVLFMASVTLFSLLFALTALVAVCLDAIEMLRQTAATDPLSGVFNRRGLEERVTQKAGSRGTAVILADIDHFKAINDGYGHATGDMVIATLGRLIQSTVGTIGSVARIGGEEFAVHLTAVSGAEAQALAETLRQAVATAKWPSPLEGRRLTASFGVALAHGEELFGETLLRADRNLYAAKHAGRNRVVFRAAAEAQVAAA
ncbi:GGDEF domain-containing protein [Aurantimonas sp. MSK8Z-1]|uniref:GGDEF domain-containing protein n=1 Tax=Mangrovibrevibacter kandeliae TaxID=2968473 RepID=UPI002118B04E|nr:GGDEF domain-containing protein [Aurantimonas sp. MSK8Z-1]MCW4115792.1 GGDEF domain-containing protein [Aurantimonas sp. MSK8Z-1]